MALQFNQLPPGVVVEPHPFEAHTPESTMNEFKQLLKLSKVGPVTYENSLKDGSLGLSHEWLVKAKEEWLNKFDW